MNTLNGIILAGGLSSRFGSCKTKLKLNKQSILASSFDLLKLFCKDVSLSCHEDKKISHYPCIYDQYPCRAPINGIYSSLLHYKSPILVLSCDLPFINALTLEKLIDARNKAYVSNNNLHMTTFMQNKTLLIEPLVAIYEYRALSLLKTALEQEKYALSKIIPVEFREHIITEDTKPFFNINYQADLQKAKEISLTVFFNYNAKA